VALQLFETVQQGAVLLVLLAAVAAIAIIAVVLLSKRGKRAKNKSIEVQFKWAAVVDWRGLVVEAQGPVDSAAAAYVVQAARVLEEVGKPVTLRARVGTLELELSPHEEEGLYKVVAR
jgi:hypothetical protein